MIQLLQLLVASFFLVGETVEDRCDRKSLLICVIIACDIIYHKVRISCRVNTRLGHHAYVIVAYFVFFVLTKLMYLRHPDHGLYIYIYCIRIRYSNMNIQRIL